MRTLLTIKEVSEELGVSPKTISRWVHDKKFEVVELPSGRYRIDREVLEEMRRERDKA
jgi:excisionase family DNA binding protein